MGRKKKIIRKKKIEKPKRYYGQVLPGEKRTLKYNIRVSPEELEYYKEFRVLQRIREEYFAYAMQKFKENEICTMTDEALIDDNYKECEF